jgi:hypothetical protein
MFANTARPVVGVVICKSKLGTDAEGYDATTTGAANGEK